jgi:hypothetical protein
MSSTDALHMEINNKTLKSIQRKKLMLPILGIGIVITVTILAVSVVTLVRVNKQYDESSINDKRSRVSSKALQQSSNSMLASSLRIEEVMSYLNEMQRIATTHNGTRAINTRGFNATLDFISNYLTANTNYKVTKSFFSVKSTELARQPIFISSINGNITNHTYSHNVAAAEFYDIRDTTSTKLTGYSELSVIPNVGCSDNDWRNARPSPISRAALVKRGDCSFVEKVALAAKYNVTALLIYNDGASPDRMSPVFVSLGDNNTLPALFLSFQLGQKLADAAQRTPSNVRVLIDILRRSELPFPVGNICADTPTGDATQTIVIGSHSDSVTEGAGINDNGKFTISITFHLRSPSPFRYR